MWLGHSYRESKTLPNQDTTSFEAISDIIIDSEGGIITVMLLTKHNISSEKR